MESQTIPKKTIGDYIKQIGAYGILLTFFAIGIAVAGAIWSSTVADLNNQLGQSRVALNNATQELDQVKTDYLTYKTLHEGNSNLPSISKPNNTVIKPVDTVVKALTPKVEIVRINTEKSSSFFGGELTISLIAIPFGGDPLRHTVTANISSPSGKVMRIDGQDIGTVSTYIGNKKYKVTILEVETFSATFQVITE